MDTKIRNAALRYHDAGVPVIPCEGKNPGVNGARWQNAKLAREELDATLSNGKARNIGVVLNHAGFIDVECDDDPAEQSLQEMFGGKIPPTPTYKSRRGKHRLFRRPDNLPDKAVEKIDGVEFRLGTNGKGAFSVLPPSFHPDTNKRYRWLKGLSLDKVDPAELPPEIVDRLHNADPPPAAKSGGDDSIPEGQRNAELYKRACALVNLKLPPETVEATLLDLNERLCDPPLPEKEVRAIAKSAANNDGDPKVGFLERLLGEVELWHDQNGDPYITLEQNDDT